MKTEEELSTLKEEVETLNKKLAELNEDELKEIVGGMKIVVVKGGNPFTESNSTNIIQEREERLRYGWLDQGTP